jgi:hypothetical protein
MQETAAGLGGDIGADLGAEELGGEELGGEEFAPEEAAPEELEVGEEEVLLAAPGEEAGPGRREDNPSSISKGKAYYRVKPHRDRRSQGAVERHRAALAGINMDPRKTFPGKSGYGGLDSLAKGMFEAKETNYENGFLSEEKKMHDINFEIKRLINSLEKSTEAKDETKA